MEESLVCKLFFLCAVQVTRWQCPMGGKWDNFYFYFLYLHVSNMAVFHIYIGKGNGCFKENYNITTFCLIGDYALVIYICKHRHTLHMKTCIQYIIHSFKCDIKTIPKIKCFNKFRNNVIFNIQKQTSWHAKLV